MTPFDGRSKELARMMTHREVCRYLEWRATQMREDARKARLLLGPASDLFATALEGAAEYLQVAANEAKERNT